MGDQGNQRWDYCFRFDISNIGSKISYSSASIQSNFIPTNLRLGPSFTLNIDDYNSIAFSLDLSKLLVPTPPVTQYDSVSKSYVIIKGWITMFPPIRGNIPVVFTMHLTVFKEELQEIDVSGSAEYCIINSFYPCRLLL